MVAFGTATAAVQGAKTVSKVAAAFTEVAIGWGSSIGFEVAYNMGLPPQMVFLTHIGVSVAVGKKSNIQRVENIADELGLQPGQVKDVMKYTGSSISDFEKIVKKGNLDDILKGASGADLLSGMSPEDVKKYLEWNDLVMKGITAEERYNLSKFGSIKTQLDYTTSTGLKLQATHGKTTTVLGTYKSDTGAIVDELGNIKSTNLGPKDGGFNLLNIPDDEYLKLSPDEFWKQYNKPWLDEAINRGDIIKMATEPTYNNLTRINNITGKVELSGFGKEYKYLKSKGYIFDSITKSMIKK